MTYAISQVLQDDVAALRAVLDGLPDDAPELPAALVAWASLVDVVIIDIETQIAGHYGGDRRRLREWSAEWSDAYAQPSEMPERRVMIEAAQVTIEV